MRGLEADVDADAVDGAGVAQGVEGLDVAVPLACDVLEALEAEVGEVAEAAIEEIIHRHSRDCLDIVCDAGETAGHRVECRRR